MSSGYRIYRCSKCPVVFLVLESDGSIHLLKETMNCPSFKCKGKISVKAITNIKIPGAKPITALDLYQASMGIGTSEERKCSSKDVQKLLVGATVAKVSFGKSLDPSRSVINSITLENGKTIHLATSTQGPMVFKITED